METGSVALSGNKTSVGGRDSVTREVTRRRTFGIISHPDAGKTTLTEKLLLFSGAIQLAGTVKARKSGRHATSDWMDIEKQRGISVASSVMQFEYRNHVVNLLDTPGHQDFSEDTYRVLTAVDSALMVIDAAKGVEAQTIKLLNVCRMRNTPIITFINKMDRETRDPVELLDEVESVLDIQCAPVTWPVGMGKTFRGVYHLLRDEILLFEAGGERADQDLEVVQGIDNPRLAEMFPMEIQQLKSEIELLQGASHPFDHAAFLAGKQTRYFLVRLLIILVCEKFSMRCWIGHRRHSHGMQRYGWSDRLSRSFLVSCLRYRLIWMQTIVIVSLSCGCVPGISNAA